MGYFRGDRSSTLEFPWLTDMTIWLTLYGLPKEYGWVTPELRRVRLLSRCRMSEDEFQRDQDALQRWLDVDAGYPCDLFADCLKLESITISKCSGAEEQGSRTTQIDWFELLPPQPLP